MKADFWHRKWARDEIGFHQPGVNALLKTYWPMLGVAQGAAVLVPLCGKSQDMVWLHAAGHPVLGVELSEKALADFLTENGLNGRPAQHDRFCGYELEDMTLFCGDFFHLSADDCEGVQAVYDRAALVALPSKMRRRYAEHMTAILGATVPMLLIGLEYDQTLKAGPPFSVPEREIRDLFGDRYQIEVLHSENFERKGVSTTETVYRLTPLNPA